MDNQRRFFLGLAKKLAFDPHVADNWYSLTSKTIRQHGGSSLLQVKYKNSPYLALSTIFPTLNLLPWKFGHAPLRYWRDRANQRRYMEWLGAILNIKSMEDWYNIRQEDVEKNYGGGLLALFKGSPSKLLAAVFPEVDWVPWRFNYVSQTKLYTKEKLMNFLDHFKSEYLIEKDEDWYRVSNAQIAKSGGDAVVRHYGGLYQALKLVYPSVKWDEARFLKKGQKKSSQRWLYLSVRKLFPNLQVIEEYREEGINNDTGSLLEIDVFVPELKLAFEYQGRQHFEDTMMFGLSQQYKDRDEIKKNLCQQKGYELFQIPYWWKGDVKSLVETIREKRPDLLKA